MGLKQNNLLVKIAYLPDTIFNAWSGDKKEALTQINFWVFCFKLIISPVLTPFVLFALGITIFFLFGFLVICGGAYVLEWIIGFIFTCKPNNNHWIDSFYVGYEKWPTIKGYRIYPAFFLLFLPIICIGLDFYYGNKTSPDTPIILIINILLIIIVIFWKKISALLISLKKHATSKRFNIKINKKGE